MERARLAVDGLSVGDAFGGQFFIPANRKLLFGPRREAPPPPWGYTDDTEMALGILEVLDRRGRIDQDELARVFGHRYQRNLYRGYGPGAHDILAALHRGEPWKATARFAFGGSGSYGNGAAMRVAPAAAYFADDLTRVVAEAARSAEVTHAHPEGVAGAVAVAAASAYAWRERDRVADEAVRRGLFDAVLALTPAGEVRNGVEKARQLDPEVALATAVSVLGNGSRVTAQDTVPFTLWVSARHLHNYVEALWTTVHGGGDVDTTAAIVGGVVGLACGYPGIPPEWLEAREALEYRVPPA
jgi:ADP-ribosylglycohydrolase